MASVAKTVWALTLRHFFFVTFCIRALARNALRDAALSGRTSSRVAAPWRDHLVAVGLFITTCLRRFSRCFLASWRYSRARKPASGIAHLLPSRYNARSDKHLAANRRLLATSPQPLLFQNIGDAVSFWLQPGTAPHLCPATCLPLKHARTPHRLRRAYLRAPLLLPGPLLYKTAQLYSHCFSR